MWNLLDKSGKEGESKAEQLPDLKESALDPIKAAPELKFKRKLEGPTEDLLFANWHPKGPVVLAGGKDMMVWMFNAVSGEFWCWGGHEQVVNYGEFSPDGKVAISASEDCTLRVWAPRSGKCMHLFRSGKQQVFHHAGIGTFAVSSKKPVIVSGDR